ncbi:MAG: aminotransferase class III-fold pyridoxal phosphate-dependent enzyme [Chloroflexi bacterium]|nr:MAG: aminotransferase class III-fold pyridoxal phosphate-dependent enzyme [Chloroflexota bacterium]MBL1193964.1 acetylornithine/succinylornithine family transaminase [Chloroflexota bacterium]NOH11259.1 acetylornithine/succinylornithine family transaminase [Chloroflexota bacterium]
MSTVASIEDQYTSGVYRKRDLTIVRGEGALLWDEAGNQYIDCVGGQGAANLGHAHPKITEAISQQAQKLISCPEMFHNDQRAELLQKLIGVAPTGIERAFLCNSGTEAIEAAMKFARLATGRTEIVAAMRGFHGRTMGALSATWNKKIREPFHPLVPGITHTPYNNLEKLETKLTENTAALILEIVQGEGGVHLGTEEFLKGAQQLCNERGVLLIVDEIQTGFGRTGKMFTVEHYGIQADILCLAKSMAGGVPMGAVLLGERVGQLPVGAHGSTFGGNPLACSASLATLETLKAENLIAHAAEMGDYLISELQKIESPLIREVRGLGLIVGIELKQKVAPYIASLTTKGVLALPAGLNVLRLLPPLVITKAQVDQIVEALSETLTQEAV